MTIDRKSEDFLYLAKQLLSDQGLQKPETPQFTAKEAPELIEFIEQTVRPVPHSVIDLVLVRSIPHRSFKIRVSPQMSNPQRLLPFGYYAAHLGSSQGLA